MWCDVMIPCGSHKQICVWAAFQITRQVKAHEGSVFCMCEMRSGTLLTGGGKDRKIILWDHEIRAERDIEVQYRYVHQSFSTLYTLKSYVGKMRSASHSPLGNTSQPADSEPGDLWVVITGSLCRCLQIPDQYGAIRAVSEGKGEEFLVGTSRNFILRGTFNDGFQVEVQVRPPVSTAT